MRRRSLLLLLLAAAVVIATIAARGHDGGLLKSLLPVLHGLLGH